jgi:mRNA-degrading endonuclease toxin of MazEF toxin-antitoxin module
MVNYPDQGDIVSVDDIRFKLLVVSNRVFNSGGAIMACPILKDAEAAALHIRVESNIINGYALCEQLKFFNLKKRSFRTLGRISLYQLMDISDAIQGIFEL